MSKILIVGAGDVGGRIAYELATLGHQVWALRRRLPDDLAEHPATLTWLAADVTEPASLVLPDGLDVVIYALAPGESGVAAYERVYLGGAQAVQAALAGQALCHQIWLSSTGVYGEDAGEWVDEQTPALPRRDSAKVLLAAEQVIGDAPWPSTIVRLGGLYGPGRERLLRWVREGRAVQRVPASWSNRLHVADASGLVVHLVQQVLAGKAVAPVVLGVDDTPTPQYEVLAWLAEQLQLPMPPEREGGSQGKRMRNTSLRETGYALKYPSFRDGYLAIIKNL